LEDYGELLFTLSSVDRMKLLSEMSDKEMRLTDLSESLDVTAQEVSKHLARLSRVGMVERAPSGSYRVTPFGKIILQTMPSMQFVSQKRKYFSTHDISFLPQEFIMRLGDLADHVFVDHVTNVLTECQHLLGLAQQYFLWTIDQPLPWTLPKPLSENLSARCILPASVTMNGYRQAKRILGIKSEVRFAKEVKIGVAVNERMGGVVFPDLEGKIDYASGFIGYGPAFQKWCYDLFNKMWESSSKRWPGELIPKTEARGPQPAT
jgi:predicted transcriptional regulator